MLLQVEGMKISLKLRIGGPAITPMRLHLLGNLTIPQQRMDVET